MVRKIHIHLGWLVLKMLLGDWLRWFKHSWLNFSSLIIAQRRRVSHLKNCSNPQRPTKFAPCGIASLRFYGMLEKRQKLLCACLEMYLIFLTVTNIFRITLLRRYMILFWWGFKANFKSHLSSTFMNLTNWKIYKFSSNVTFSSSLMILVWLEYKYYKNILINDFIGPGALLFLYSAVWTRGFENTRTDLDSSKGAHLMGKFH